MAKTEVYSWRVDPAMKMDLEGEARRQKISFAELLDRMARQYLEELRRDDDAEQARIRKEVMKYAGSISAEPDFSQNVSAKIRAMLKERHARKRSA